MILCLGTTPTLARTMQFARIHVDGVNRATHVYEYAAGKAVNAARAAQTLGEAVACVSPCGAATGRRLVTRLIEGLGEGHVGVDVESESRLCITALDGRGKTSTELIQESNPLTAAEGERLFAAFSARFRGAKFVVLSGSLAPGLATDFYARCVASCAAANVRVILDASGEPLRAALAAKPFAVKINAAELGQLAGCAVATADEVAASAADVAAETGGLVIVTRGAAATVVAEAGGRRLFCDVPRVEVVSAIGSGDSFAGGLAVGLARGHSTIDAVRLATAAAAANATTAHAAHFTLGQVEALLASSWP